MELGFLTTYHTKLDNIFAIGCNSNNKSVRSATTSIAIQRNMKGPKKEAKPCFTTKTTKQIIEDALKDV